MNSSRCRRRSRRRIRTVNYIAVVVHMEGKNLRFLGRGWSGDRCEHLGDLDDVFGLRGWYKRVEYQAVDGRCAGGGNGWIRAALFIEGLDGWSNGVNSQIFGTYAYAIHLRKLCSFS